MEGKETNANEVADTKDVINTDGGKEKSLGADEKATTDEATPKKVEESEGADNKALDDKDEAGGPGERKNKRVRKAVEEIYKADIPKEKVKMVVEQGKGQSLGDIPFVESHIKKTSPDDLKMMHMLLFGRKGAAKSVRANLRQFSGLVYSGSQSKQDLLAKKERWMDDQSVKTLKSFGNAFGVQTGGTKSDLIARLMAFIDKPREMTAPRASPKKSTPRKGTPTKQAKALTAWQWYCKERRPAQAAYQKDKSTAEITEILKTMWESETPASKAKYKTMAESYAQQAGKKDSKKATPKKSQKKTPKKSTSNKINKKKATVSSEIRDDDHDDDKDGDEEEPDVDTKSPAKRKLEEDSDDVRTMKKAAKLKEDDDNHDDEDEDEDDGSATGLEADKIDEIKGAIRDYLSMHENIKEVRSKHVRKHLGEKMPTLEFTSALKEFVQNHAITVINQLSSDK